MYVIRNTKERVWVLVYDPAESFAKLKWTWTLEWMRATSFESEAAAHAKAKEYEIEHYVLEKAYEPK